MLRRLRDTKAFAQPIGNLNVARLPYRRLDRLTVFKHVGGGYVLAGEMTFEGGEFLRPGAFQYDQSYLETPGATPLDPLGLPVVSQVFPGVPEAPLALLDTGPEGWGRSVLAMGFEGSVLGAAEFLAAGTTDRTGDLAFGASVEAGPGHWRPDGSLSSEISPNRRSRSPMLAAIAADESDATADQSGCSSERVPISGEPARR